MIYPVKIFTFLAITCASLCASDRPRGSRTGLARFGQEGTTRSKAASAPSSAAAVSHCEIIGTREIKITCTYATTPRLNAGSNDSIRLVLNRAALSFGTVRDSYMLIDLTFTNEGPRPLPGSPRIFLAVEDESGHNMVRRVLPKIDLSTLGAGVPTTFSERLLVGGFRPGRYRISLLIPNPAPSLRDNPRSNLLLSSEGVADPVKGSNTIADFLVRP